MHLIAAARCNGEIYYIYFIKHYAIAEITKHRRTDNEMFIARAFYLIFVYVHTRYCVASRTTQHFSRSLNCAKRGRETWLFSWIASDEKESRNTNSRKYFRLSGVDTIFGYPCTWTPRIFAFLGYIAEKNAHESLPSLNHNISIIILIYITIECQNINRY